MADLKISSAPNILRASGIGSCLAVTIYDIEKKIGGLAHVMLPNSTKVSHANPYRFADRAIEIILEEFGKKGSKKEDLEAKVIGGANMFKVLDISPEGIGAQNVTAAVNKLKKEGIKIVATDTGENCGRSAEFDLKTGLVTVKTRI